MGSGQTPYNAFFFSINLLKVSNLLFALQISPTSSRSLGVGTGGILTVGELISQTSLPFSPAGSCRARCSCPSLPLPLLLCCLHGKTLHAVPSLEDRRAWRGTGELGSGGAGHWVRFGVPPIQDQEQELQDGMGDILIFFHMAFWVWHAFVAFSNLHFGTWHCFIHFSWDAS